MTMNRMNTYLEEKGFDVLRERDSKRDLYIFTISRPGYGPFTKEFKYPATNDPKYRDLQMREFLDGMVRDFYKIKEKHATDPYTILQQAILERDMVELHIDDAIMPAQITNCTVSNCDMDLPTFEGFIDINHATSKRLDRSDMVRDPLPKAYRDYVNRTPLPNIKDVIHNDPATIVFWTDGTKTVVKCQPGDKYDPEKGLAMAISKKALGNQGNYYNVFEKWLPELDRTDDLLELTDSLRRLNDRLKRALNVFYAKHDDPSLKSKVFTCLGTASRERDNLRNIACYYGRATVADWYDICGLEHDNSDTTRGWIYEQLADGIEITGTPDDGYEVKLPPTIEFDKNKIFRTRYEAEKAIDELLESARTYSFATLADWKEICDLDADFTMVKRGWTFDCLLHNMPKAMLTRDGYEVALPRPVDLGFDNDGCAPDPHYDPVQKAYDILKGLRDGDNIEEVIDDVIGYLGEALDK